MKAIHYHPGRKLTANCLNTLIDRVPVAEQKRSLNHELFNLACLLFEMARSGGACELMKARLCEIGMENAQDEGKRAVIFKHYAKGTLDEHFALGYALFFQNAQYIVRSRRGDLGRVSRFSRKDV